MQQILTIEPGGAISGLQHKKGLDLRSLGKVQIERVSEIVFDEDEQAWFVQPIRGPFAGKPLTLLLWAIWTEGSPPAGSRPCVPVTGKLFFDSYDDAVVAEVAFLDAARLRGKF